VKRPTIRMSTPISRIQSGMASHTSPSGIPEAKDMRLTEAVRHDVNARAMLSQVPSFFCGDETLLK
jgi:hypothetical protein